MGVNFVNVLILCAYDLLATLSTLITFLEALEIYENILPWYYMHNNISGERVIVVTTLTLTYIYNSLFTTNTKKIISWNEQYYMLCSKFKYLITI